MKEIVKSVTPIDSLVSFSDIVKLDSLELTRKELLSQGFEEEVVNETIRLLTKEYF